MNAYRDALQDRQLDLENRTRPQEIDTHPD